MAVFSLNSEYQPAGDQGQAIAKLLKSLRAGNKHQTLLGVTGSGKTFTMANCIAGIGRPTLVLSHNKTLAAQLYSEFKGFFPDNAVEYFVSYFDYYQPEAYMPHSDTYIEKDSAINDEIERHRLSTMSSLLTREDVIVVASVSCIYGLGAPDDYQNMMANLQVGQEYERDKLIFDLLTMLFERNDVAFERSQFRVRGDVVEVRPAFLENTAIRVEFFGDEIEKISTIALPGGQILEELDRYSFYPAKQFVTPRDKLVPALSAIREEMKERVAWFEKHDKLIEAQRIKIRTENDLASLAEMGFCPGVENYSRHLSGREPGSTPYTLLDFFPQDFFSIIDESHVTIPQIGGMFAGDLARKKNLVDYGFRLPSALDNRPLRFDEFMGKNRQLLYVSATPATFELLNSAVGNTDFVPLPERKNKREPKFKIPLEKIKTSGATQSLADFAVQKLGTALVVEQIIRPTGLLDPIIQLRPLKNQIDDTIELCRVEIEKTHSVLITTLTKKTAEHLTDYLRDLDFRVAYIHHDIDAIERIEILRSLRAGKIDILIGINLLREGLDLPEVALVCILDADKEGFLRSETSLVQTAGRAARHAQGRVVLFADEETGAIAALRRLSEKRRQIQQAHNQKHGITPQSVVRSEQASLQLNFTIGKKNTNFSEEESEIRALIAELNREMLTAAEALEYEKAAHLRDQITLLEKKLASS